MKKSMKKTMKSMKKKGGMKKKAKKVSKIAKGRGAKARVFSGKKEKTTSGLKKTYQKNGLAKWTKACQQARKAMGIKGFQAIGGKTAKGQALLKKARSFFKK